MKFYRLRHMKHGMYFLSVSEEDMKYQVNSRNRPSEYYPNLEELNNPDSDDWWYDTVEIDDRAIGICINNFPKVNTPSLLTTSHSPICSVGMVRTERSGYRQRSNDIFKDKKDEGFGLMGTCSSCPYFISYKQLEEIVESNFSTVEKW